MTKKQWIKKITEDCKAANTYKNHFDSVIDTLAQILETRDQVHQQYIDEGSKPTIIVTTDRSNKENIHKNPLISMEIDLNAQALKYLVELGLTYKSMMSEQKMQMSSDSSLEDLLKEIAK